MYGTGKQTTGEAGSGAGCLPHSPKMEPVTVTGLKAHLEIKLLLVTSVAHLKPVCFQVSCKFWLTFFPP